MTNCINVQITYLSNLYCRVQCSDSKAFNVLVMNFSERIGGIQFAPTFRSGKWDGRKYFISKITGRCPIGLLPMVAQYARQHGYIIKVNNKYPHIKPQCTKVDETFLDGITLRDYQIEAINTALKKPIGIIKSSTGSGKTECICGVVKSYSNAKAILILVNKKDLVTQTRARMLKRGITDVGVYYGDERDDTKHTTIATVQSVVRPESYVDKNGKKKTKHIITCPDLLAKVEVIITDECKHTGAATVLHVIEKCKATVRYGFDATPFEHGDRMGEFEIKKFLGDIVFDLDTQTLIDKGVLTKPRIKMIKIKSEVPVGADFHVSYDLGIVNHKKRNNIIAHIANSKKGRILVLINRIEQGDNIHKLIEGSLYMHGTSSNREETINMFNDDKSNILIGSTIFDEAIDFSKGIDCLIVASAGKNFRRTIQRLGRALRKNDKGYVEVYDFLDSGNKYLRRHSTLRRKYYEIEGHEIKVI